MKHLLILPYLFALSLMACHPAASGVKHGLDKAARLITQDPDTASVILESIRSDRMDEAQLAQYNLLCTQADEEKNIPHTSARRMRQAVDYYSNHGTPLQRSKAYFYLACVESDLSESTEAESYFQQAISLATQADEYGLAVKACRRCSLYYQKQKRYDEALTMERKAYANQLLLNADDGGRGLWMMSSGLLAVCLLMLSIGALWRKSQRAHIQLLTMRCGLMEEKYQQLQTQVYEHSSVVAKVRRFKERDPLARGRQPAFGEADWNELLRLQEEVFGFVGKLKALGPKLTEEDLRVCAFLREGVPPACFSDLLKLTPETLTRRISRIKTEKLMLVGEKASLEEVVKAL
ncbi:MAG: tetratricopeptide repeat protein [Mediterranea sp.]|jgi:tetratricopeptide (TPR) repeat protein|nr:tetratricopeptide repeat protein [Mediterranea sp.]